MKTQESVTRRTIFPRHVFYGWYIVAAGMGLHLWVGMVGSYALQVFFTPIVQTFGWSRAVVSGAFSLNRIEGSVATPIEGFLVDRFGPRMFIMAGAFVLGLGLVLLSYINSLWLFYVSMNMVSLGSGLCIGVPRNWTIVHWFQRLRGRALGIVSTGGVLIGSLLFIVVWLVDAVGWQPALRILGVATWVICVPLGLVFRARPEQYGYLPDGDPPPGAGEAPSPLPARRAGGAPGDAGGAALTARQALRTRAFWVLAVVFGATGMGTSALIVHMIPYFESIGFTRAQATSAVALFSLLSGVGRLGGGWVIDYLDKRVMMAGILLLQVAAFLLLANVTVFWQVAPFALLYGIAFGAMMPANPVIVSTYFGTRSYGAIQGLIGSATVVSGVVAPVMMGWIFDQTGDYRLAVYILAAVAAAAVPVTFFARPPRPSVEAQAGASSPSHS